MNQTKPNLFYITGRRGNYLQGLGQYLQTLPVHLSGLSMSDDFCRLDFSSQIDVLKEQLLEVQPTHIIAVSIGGYLLLHTLLQLGVIDAQILLISPVLGKGNAPGQIRIPPRAKTLKAIMEAGEFPTPRYLEIQTGELDVGCDPSFARQVADLINADKCIIIPHQGHMIDRQIVQRFVSDFIREEAR